MEKQLYLARNRVQVKGGTFFAEAFKKVGEVLKGTGAVHEYGVNETGAFGGKPNDKLKRKAGSHFVPLAGTDKRYDREARKAAARMAGELLDEDGNPLDPNWGKVPEPKPMTAKQLAKKMKKDELNRWLGGHSAFDCGDPKVDINIDQIMATDGPDADDDDDDVAGDKPGDSSKSSETGEGEGETGDDKVSILEATCLSLLNKPLIINLLLCPYLKKYLCLILYSLYPYTLTK